MGKLLDELNKYKKSCEDDNGYVIEGKAEDLVFKSAEVIERYEKALKKIEENCAGSAPSIARHALKGKFENV